MHRVPLIVLAAGLSAGCRERADPPSAARDDARMRDEVTAFEREWAAAATARTRGKLDSLMADEWTITLSDGRRSDKRRALVRWAAPASGGVLRDTSIVDSVEVRALSPDAAVAVPRGAHRRGALRLASGDDAHARDRRGGAARGAVAGGGEPRIRDPAPGRADDEPLTRRTAPGARSASKPLAQAQTGECHWSV